MTHSLEIIKHALQCVSILVNKMFNFCFDEFSERLKELRVSKHLTLEELARGINSTRATICNFEKQNKTPSLEMLLKLATYFDVSLDYLMGRTEDPLSHK